MPRFCNTGVPGGTGIWSHYLSRAPFLTIVLSDHSQLGSPWASDMGIRKPCRAGRS
ncbi:hypothetical protein CBM2585_B80416 [Cupriavidus taiwanensis]|nr:hypothetical protein CBM2585_B80416 [Cupriavidus taiwanensis]